MSNDTLIEPSPSVPVVTAPWLHEHLHHPQVAIVDCRFSLADPEAGRRQYHQGHLPGAHYFDLNQDLSGPVAQHGGRHPLPNPAVLAEKLTAAGIYSALEHQPARWVVAYDDSRFAFAARFWWLLRYLGHDRVWVLDGGFRAWQALSYPVTTEVPPLSELPSQKFVPQVNPHSTINRATIKAQKDSPQVALVDAREADRYRGEREPIDPVAGHIPGAVNYPWQETTNAEGFIYPAEQQQQRWADLKSKEEIWVYCGSGVTACVNLLSLAAAGITTGKLYPGSWSDWCSYPE